MAALYFAFLITQLDHSGNVQRKHCTIYLYLLEVIAHANDLRFLGVVDVQGKIVT